jgi:hypothetical protein
MNIQPIIEGHGEREAFPVLLRRLRQAVGVYTFDFGKPILKHRSQLVKKETLQDSVRLALKQDGCRAVLVLFDADADCPKSIVSNLQEWASEAAGPVPCRVVLATREYEAWFLGAIESLQGKRGIRPDANFLEDPEAVRDAKGALEELMVETADYMETIDQPALSDLFDMAVAFRRCRSFRKLVKCFGELLVSLNVPLADWPPREWRVE